MPKISFVFFVFGNFFYGGTGPDSETDRLSGMDGRNEGAAGSGANSLDAVERVPTEIVSADTGSWDEITCPRGAFSMFCAFIGYCVFGLLICRELRYRGTLIACLCAAVARK